MKTILALLLVLVSFPLLAEQTLFFMEDDLSVIPVTVPGPAPEARDAAVGELAEKDLRDFLALSEDDPVPGPLAYLAEGACCRYAILGYGFPTFWRARDITEVFHSREQILSFILAHHSRRRGRVAYRAGM